MWWFSMKTVILAPFLGGKRRQNPKSINWLARRKENELLDIFQSVRHIKHLLISATLLPFVVIYNSQEASVCLKSIKKKNNNSLQ